MVRRTSKKDGYVYTKRPFWQWVVIYLIVGVIVYALAYYFLFASKGSSPLGY